MRTLWTPGTLSRLNGELDKRGHPILSAHALAGAIPDFLVHQPGRVEGNNSIMEVKAERAQPGAIANDLTKLGQFRIEAGYERAIYLVFGEELTPVLPRIQAVVAKNPPPCAIEVWVHAAPDTSAQQAMLLGV